MYTYIELIAAYPTHHVSSVEMKKISEKFRLRDPHR